MNICAPLMMKKTDVCHVWWMSYHHVSHKAAKCLAKCARTCVQIRFRHHVIDATLSDRWRGG